MPVSTRRQTRQQPELLDNSQSPTSNDVPKTASSSKEALPLPQAIPTTLKPPKRSTSPMVREDMLRGVSPNSPAYATQLSSAVDMLIGNLKERSRNHEARAMRELYNQSFKDPGSKELLDALLRIRASERQTFDFRRYVQDINYMAEKPVVAASSKAPQPSDVTKLARPTEAIEIRSSTNKQVCFGSVGVHQDADDEQRSKSAKDGLDAGSRNAQQKQIDAFLEELNEQMTTTGASEGKRPQKRRKKNKMFSGANGPVYLKNTLGLD